MSILLSPLGWTEEWLLRPLEAIRPNHVVILHTSHPKTLATLTRAKAAIAKRNGAPTVESVVVRPDFDFVAWFRAFEQAVSQFPTQEVTINLTPGHGFAIAMAAVSAAMRGLPCIIYDDDAKETHYASPGILLHLHRLADADKKILEKLRSKSQTVSKLSETSVLPLSTVSTSLQRLYRQGFVKKAREKQFITYSLREGVEEFLPSIIA